MTVDEAKAVAERAHLGSTMVTDLVEAVQCLAAAVRDDDYVRLPDGHEQRRVVDLRDADGVLRCLRKDLPKPTLKVVLKERVCHCSSSGWFTMWSEKQPSAVVAQETGNTREIEVPNE